MTYADRLQGIESSQALKAPVQVATTANITLSGEQTIDGVTVVSGDRVLVKDQTDGTQNGIWVAAPSTWARATDFNGARDATQGTLVFVVAGTTSAGLVYKLTTAAPAIGTSSLSFAVAVGLTVTDYMASLLVASDGPAARTALGLGTISTQNSDNVSVTGGKIKGTISAVKGEEVSAATNLTIPADGNYFFVTGDAPIQGLTFLGDSRAVTLHFLGSPSISHNSISLILPNGADITAYPGYVAVFYEHDGGQSVLVTDNRSTAASTTEAFEVYETIGTWTHSGDVGYILFEGMGSYHELDVFLESVTWSVSGKPFMQLGTGDPASISTTNYRSYTYDDSTGDFTTTGIFLSDTNVSSAGSAVLKIQNFNDADLNTHVTGNSTGRFSVTGHREVDEANTAIQFTAPGGGNFTGGKVVVRGRRSVAAETPAPTSGAFDIADVFGSGESGFILDPSESSYQFTNSGATPAVADDFVDDIKDILGSGISFTTGVSGERPQLKTDGVSWWYEVSGGQRLSVSGSTGMFNFFHDGSGCEIMMGVRIGSVENPNTTYAILDNTNLTANDKGVGLYYDDRTSLPRNNHIHHMVSTAGGVVSSLAKNASYDNLIQATHDGVIGVGYKEEAGDEYLVHADGKTMWSSGHNTGATGDASNNLTLFSTAGSLSNNMVGRLYYLVAINRRLTDFERSNMSALISSKMASAQNEVALHSFDAGSRVEWFVDQSEIDTSAGVTFDVQRPQKSASNPVSEPVGANTATYDYDKYYPTVLYESGTYKAWIGAAGGATPWDDAQATYMTSGDGISWTKPNLGLVTYDGNTNNNLLPLGYDTTVHHDGSEYVIMQGAPLGGGSVGDEVGRIYTSADGITSFTLEKTLDPSSFHPGLFQFEFHGMAPRSDGRWVAYYTFNHDADRRSIAAYVSDTSDVSGAWTHQGLLTGFDAYEDIAQHYSFSASLINGVLYGLSCRFDDITERIWMDLYTSPGGDGVTWTPRKGLWVPTGRIRSGAYDGGMIVGKNILDNGTETRAYYTASVDKHFNDGDLRDSRLSYAALPTGRLGVVKGAGGTVVTTEFTATTDLKVNSVSTGGNLKVELLDPSDDSVITGFAKADCDSLDGDNSAKVVTWGAVSIPTGYPVKLKFYLDA